MRRVKRACRVGRDIFDIHGPAGTAVIPAVIRTGIDDGVDFGCPETRLDPDVDKTRAGNLDAGHPVDLGQRRTDGRSEIARLHAGRLGKNHGGVAGDVAMRRIARQLEDHAAGIQIGRQGLSRLHAFNYFLKLFFEKSENIHVYLRIGPGSKSR